MDMLDDRPGPSIRHRRAGGAATVSLLAHAALIVLAVVLHRSTPPLDPAPPERPSLTYLVWEARAAPSGGDRGGGAREKPDAGRAAADGRDRVTVPVAPPPDPTPAPTPADREPLPLQPIAVVPRAADLTSALGPVEPDRATSAESRGPGDGNTGAGTGTGNADGPGRGRGDGDGDVFGIGNGVAAPRLLRSVRPEYTADAMRARIQGTVSLDCVVDTAGRVDRCLVRRSLDSIYGLDQQALRAARQWSFEPGTRQGVPVAVRVAIELSFNMR
jgi:protein TonB